MPSTLKRSPKKAQDTYAKTHDSAVEQYGEGERAHRTAFSALKHSFEKVGDHWEPKAKKGPSDAKAAGGRDTQGRDRGWRRRQRQQGAPDGTGEAARHQRPQPDDQG